MSPLFALLFSPMEWAVVGIIGVILFGKRLPDVGRYLGKSLTEFKKGMKGLEDDLDVGSSHSAPVAQQQHNPVPEAIRPPQRVAATAPKFEDVPATNPPQV